jgi:tetratricopeptide (TPR) repeat protein
MYAAVCIVSYPTNNSRRLPAQSIGLSVGILSLFLFFQLVVAAKAYRQCSNIMNNTVTSDETETARQMAVLQAPMQSSVYYWHSYGSLFYQYKNYALAADKLEQASRFSSDPNLYIMLGNCYRATARYAEARQAYTLAGNIEPHHFAPRYALMKLYADTRDTANALLLAQQIVHMQPKIPSGKVTRFKTEARDVLQLFTTKNNSK